MLVRIAIKAIVSHDSFFFAWRTTHETTNEMEENRIAANREELTEMLAKALDEKGIPRHRDQSDETSMEIGETSVMTTCMST